MAKSPLLMHAKLVGHEVVPVESFDEWMQWVKSVEDQIQIVRHDEVADRNILVSTVFLHGVNHGFMGPPKWFETCIIAYTDDACVALDESGLEGVQERYETWLEAELGHAEYLARILRWLASHRVVEGPKVAVCEDCGKPKYERGSNRCWCSFYKRYGKKDKS